MFTDREARAMEKALGLARLGRRGTFPNPMVGAVILDENGNEAGEGYHRKYGETHAEVFALAAAGERAKGGTLVVTLEPCCHWGRTGPCTERIIRAGISRVIIAMRDPDSRVNGKGEERLRNAGIEVETGLMKEEAERLNRGYLHYGRKGRSFVVLKYAVSLDGRIAAADGGSRWVTGMEARKIVHAVRARVSAVMTGGGTLRRDDPELTVRHLDIRPEDQPAKIIVTASGNLGNAGRFLSSPGRAVIAVPSGTEVRFRVEPPVRPEIWEIAPGPGGLDLRELLKRTAEEGMGEILCEAGPGLSTPLLSAGLADSLMVFVAPLLLGAGGKPAVGDLGIGGMDGAVRLKNVRHEICGEDFLVEGDIVYGVD